MTQATSRLASGLLGAPGLLTGIVTVIDAVNFKGYDDKTYTARLQAQYTDLILINKHELVSEQHLDRTLDDVYDLNPDTPKVRTNGAGGQVDPGLVFGLDSALFASQGEVEAAEAARDGDHHAREVDLLQIRPAEGYEVARDVFTGMLDKLPKDDVYRGKGLVRLAGEDGSFLFNYVCGRHTIEPLPSYTGPPKMIFMGSELGRIMDTVVDALGEDVRGAMEHFPAKQHVHAH